MPRKDEFIELGPARVQGVGDPPGSHDPSGVRIIGKLNPREFPNAIVGLQIWQENNALMAVLNAEETVRLIRELCARLPV